MNPLSPRRRSELRAEAHRLNPVVIIGDKGLTGEVVAEIDRSLTAHELIKVRASGGERDSRDIWLEAICERLQAHAVQQIGKVFVIYRENPKEKEVKKAKKPATPARGLDSRLRGNDKRRGDDKKRDDGTKRTERPRSRPPSPRPASGPRRRRPRTSR
jgi:putative YhbY family RNA-binding protein